MASAGVEAFGVGQLVSILRRYWWVVVITTIVCGAGTFAWATQATPVYKSSASLYFSLDQGGTGSELNQGSAYTQNQMLSYATLATSAVVLKPVAEDLRLGSVADLRRSVTVTNPQDTVILVVTASAGQPELAARVANDVSRYLSETVSDLAPQTSQGRSTVNATVIEPAVSPIYQSSPNKRRDALLGLVFGFLLGAVGSILYTRLDPRVRTVEAHQRLTDVPVLGTVARAPKSTDRRLFLVSDPNSRISESFRRLSASLRFTAVDHHLRRLIITSAVPAEGKTTLTCNLALAIAESGRKVLLVDADLRRPRVAQYLGVEGVVGLTNVLVGTSTLDEASIKFSDTTLSVLAGGEIPPNPAELMASEKMHSVLLEASEIYDLVIVDTAPVLAVADAGILSAHVDATLVVSDVTKAQKTNIRNTFEALELAGAHVSGMVLNRVKPTRHRDDYYYGESATTGKRVAKHTGWS